MYSSQLLHHFQNPRNSGVMESPDISVQSENPACGDVMKLMLRIADNAVTEARFQVRGCVAAIACGSALTEAILGKTIGAAEAVNREAIVQAVGGLPNESIHASHLAIDCLKLALKQLRK